MKFTLKVLLFLMITTQMTAQSVSPAGIYYLEGVMETESGMKLDADSTFEFFFSQGALDRTGKGRWIVKGDEIILQSDSLPAKGFVLVKSVKIKGKKNVVVVKESNAMLLSFVYVQLSGGSPSEFLKLGNDGTMELETGNVNKVEFLFELCPERIHEFTPLHSGDNYFEFTIHPTIMDVYFDNVKAKLTEGGFEGQHPLLKGESFFYRKNN
jgi:hypothetical protein